MEDLKPQEQIINLGRLLVKELGLEDEVDTLSRWMAHYVADKMSLVERLPEGQEKEIAQRECFDVILKLWEHRWEFPRGKRPLESFEQILNVLKKIDPDKEDPFFYRQTDWIATTNKISDFDEINKYLEIIEQIDKVARIWIDFLLQQATSQAKDERTEKILNTALSMPHNYDIDTIQVLYDDMEDFTKKNKQDIFRRRIEELEKFVKLNEFLLEEYKRSFSFVKE